MVDGYRSNDFRLPSDALHVDRCAFRNDLGPTADTITRCLSPDRQASIDGLHGRGSAGGQIVGAADIGGLWTRRKGMKVVSTGHAK